MSVFDKKNLGYPKGYKHYANVPQFLRELPTLYALTKLSSVPLTVIIIIIIRH